jgi:hypothetical protein
MTWRAVVQDTISHHRNERLPVQWHNYLLATRCLPLRLRHIATLPMVRASPKWGGPNRAQGGVRHRRTEPWVTRTITNTAERKTFHHIAAPPRPHQDADRFQAGMNGRSRE